MPKLHDYMPLMEELGTRISVGEDDDAWIYANDADSQQVIKFQKNASADREISLIRHQSLYAALAVGPLPFAIDEILEIKHKQTTAEIDLLYTREKLLPGISLLLYLDALQSESGKIELAIQCYCAALGLLAQVPITAQIPRVADWRDYIRQRIHAGLSANRELLAGPRLQFYAPQLAEIDAAVYQHLSSIPAMSFIHGALNAESCFFDPADQSKPCAIAKFSENSMLGDPRLDAAGLLCFSEILPKAMRRNATRLICGFIHSEYGQDVNPVINVYRIYFAATLLGNPKYNEWALGVLGNCLTILQSTYIWQPVQPPIVNQFARRLHRHDASSPPPSSATPAMVEVTSAALITVHRDRAASRASSLGKIVEVEEEDDDEAEVADPLNLWAPLRRSSLGQPPI